MDLNPNEVFIPLASEKEINLSKCAVHEFDTGRELVFDRELSEDAVVEYDCKIHSQYRTAVEKKPPTKDTYNLKLPMSCKWNQRAKNGNFASGTSSWNCNVNYGSISASNGKLTYSITTKNPNAYVGPAPSYTEGYAFPEGHTFLITCWVTLSDDEHVAFYSGSAVANRICVKANVRTHIVGYVKRTSNTNSLYMYVGRSAGLPVGATAVIENFCAYDLTDMFGLGNEWMGDSFLKNFTEDYYTPEYLGDEVPYTCYCYGGEVDYATGVLTVRNRIVKLDSVYWVLNSTYKQIYQSAVFADAWQPPSSSDRYKNILCSAFPASAEGHIQVNYGNNGIDDFSMLTANGAFYIRCSASENDVYSLMQRLTKAELVYKLATPITYQLSPVEVKTLLNDNTFSSDADGICITYRNTDGQYVKVPISKNLCPYEQRLGATWANTDSTLLEVVNSLPAGTYTMSWITTVRSRNSTSTTNWRTGFYFPRNSSPRVDVRQTYQENPTTSTVKNCSATFEITEAMAGTFTQAYCYGVGADGVGALGTADLVDIQIEAGSPATSFEPYIKTTSAPIVFHDGAQNAPARSLIAAMTPKQSLNGYSKPWAGGCGKNKVNLNGESIGDTNYWPEDNVTTLEAGKIIGAIAINGYIRPNYIDYTISGNTITYSGNQATYYGVGLVFNAESGITYTGSTTEAGVKAFVFYDVNKKIIEQGPRSSSAVTSFSATAPQGAAYGVFALVETSLSVTYTASNIQVEVGSSPTAYEPYENICPITGTSEITVKNEGKNLFSKQDFYVSGSSIYLGKSSSQDKYSVYIPEEGTYTFSIGFKEVVRDTTGFTICETEYDPSSWITPTTCLAYTGWYVGKYFSVSMRFAGGKYYTLSFERESNQSWEANPPVDFFMLEYGDTASKYWKTSAPLLDVMLNEHCHGDVYGHVVNYEELTRRYVTYDFKIPVIRRLMNDLEPLKPLKYEVSVKNKDKYSITPTVISTKDDNFKLIDTFTSKASYKTIDTGKMKVCEINIGMQVGDTLSVTAYGEIESRIPDAYQEVEYIQSTGYEWIDTGINSKDYAQKIKIELDMQISGGHDTSMWPTQGVGNFAQANGSAWGYYMMYPTYKWTINGTSQWHFFMAMGETNPAITGSDVYWHDFGAADTNRHTFVLDAYNGIFAMDSTEVTGKASKALDSDNYGSYPLFVIKNNDGYKPNTFQKNKLYSCKMTDMSEQKVLREFVPCYRKQDNVVGLYDLVSKTFFVNQGTGAFLKGSNVYPKPIYKNLISDGTYVYTVSGGALSASIGELANLTGSMFDTYGFASLADCTTAESDIMALSHFQIMRWCESAKDFSVMTATATIAGPSAIIDTDVLDLEGKGVVGMESVSQVSNSSTMECYFDFGVNDLWYYDTTDNEWYALGESGTKGFMTPADMALIPVDKWEEKIATANKFAIKCIIEDVGDYITLIKFNFKMRSTRPQINE